MMFRKILLLVVLVVAAGSAAADDYTYIAGGGQAHFFRLPDTRNQKNTDTGIEPGFYLHGGYGFDNNLLLDLRLNYTGTPLVSIQETMLGLGYHHALSDNIDIYALAGISRYTASVDFITVSSKSFTSPTGETGLKIRLTPDISVNSALRLANYDARAYYEARLGSAYALTEHVSVEAGYQFNRWKEMNDHAGTLGVRYTF